ncbi:MAG TPA: hypothetical protein VFX28_05725, partial [Methylomirabilota bacterium]|nr:hypothetical protein [Methylomirabilota bacterium]
REVLAWHLAYLLPHLQARPLLTALGTEADGAGLDGAGAWERSDASRAYRRWLRHRSDATLADASPAVLARVRADGAGQPVIVWDVEGRLDAAPPGRRRALADTLEALAVPTALCHRGGPGARAVAELCSRRGVTCLAMPGGVDPVDWLTSQLRAGPLARLLGERRSWVLAADHPAAAARLLARGALDAAHLVRTEAAGPPAAGGRGAGPAMSLVSAHDLGGVRLREYYAPPLLSALRELSG